MVRKAFRYFRWSHSNDYSPLMKNRNTYHGVAIDAHMLATFGRQCMSDLARLAKPYFVDPHTYVFSNPREVGKGAIKSWNRSLVRSIDGVGNQRALGMRLRRGVLRPRDFGVGDTAYRGADLTGPLVAGTIAIQKNPNQSITERVGTPSTNGGGAGPPAPEFTLAPYFYAQDTTSEWFCVNARLLDEAARQKAGVYGVLCLGQAVLGDDGAARRISEAYSKAGGLLVWLSGFDDTRASVSNLERYNLLIRGLADTGKPIVALHAGHYAVMLSTRIKIHGAVRGLDMNGYKDAMGGGGPGQPRYYLQQPHTHAPRKYAARAMQWRRKMRCPCSPCVTALSAVKRGGHAVGDLYAAMLDYMDRSELKEHFMHAQKSEMDHVGANSHDVAAMVLGELAESDVRRLEEMEVPAEHIHRWMKALPE